jgi:hypothetical protein
MMVWPNLKGQLELMHIGADGETLLNRTLPVESVDAREPQLEIGPDGRLYLLWREPGEPHATIRYIQLEDDGTPVGEPQIVSDPTRWVVDPPQLVLEREGDTQARLHALWADEAGLQWAVVSAEGMLVREPTLLAPEARSPAAQLDNRGRLHLGWQEQLRRNTQGIYYALLDPESGELGEPEEMAQVFRRTGQWIEGPTIALDQEIGYVLWTLKDMRDISFHGRYASFPLELPRQKWVQALRLRRGDNPNGIRPLEGQQTPPLIALSADVAGSTLLSGAQILVTSLVHSETPEHEVWGLACAAPIGLPAPTEPRAATRVPQQVTEDVVTASTPPSLEPILVTDANSYLHLAWLETGGFDQYRVVYASTAPQVKQNYNALTLWDFVDALFRHILRLSIVVLTISPMLGFWAVIPMGGLILYHLITGEEELYAVDSWVALGAAVALEVALTILIPPRIPTAWPPLRWVAPLGTAAAAAAVTALTLRRRRGGGSLLFVSFFLFTLTHSLLQLIIYFVL